MRCRSLVVVIETVNSVTRTFDAGRLAAGTAAELSHCYHPVASARPAISAKHTANIDNDP